MVAGAPMLAVLCTSWCSLIVLISTEVVVFCVVWVFAFVKGRNGLDSLSFSSCFAGWRRSWVKRMMLWVPYFLLLQKSVLGKLKEELPCFERGRDTCLKQPALRI